MKRQPVARNATRYALFALYGLFIAAASGYLAAKYTPPVTVEHECKCGCAIIQTPRVM